MSGKPLDPDIVVASYKMILYDKWHDLDERQRRRYVRRMVFAKHGAYNESDLLTITSQVKDTEIFNKFIGEYTQYG